MSEIIVFYYSFILDDGYSFFGVIGVFRDQGEVVFFYSFLGSVESIMGVVRDLEIFIGRKIEDWFLTNFRF